tara:strand:+ start:13667 stop:15904 length:2238 start_codon:yes stop_codon:yes gene_type:complete
MPETPLTRLAQLAATAGLLLSQSIQALPSITNANFDTPINGGYTISVNQAGDGWYGPNDSTWVQQSIATNPTGQRNPDITAKVTHEKSLIQVIQDNQSSTDDAGLVFEVFAEDNGASNELTVEVYGLNTFSSGFTTGGNQVDPNSVLLGKLDTHIAQRSSSAIRYYVPLDMGTGYQFIILKVTARLSDGDSSIAVDNFEFIAPTSGSHPTFPFPQSVVYPHGLKPSNYSQVSMNKHVQTTWENYENTYFTQTDTITGEWRITRDDAEDSTVSEGIGYGMLLCVLMDNASNNTRPLFDGLYNYYLRRLNQNGLMNWRIIEDSNGILPDPYSTDIADAADADEDVALALVFAHRQWGSESGIPYLDQAQILITRLQEEVCKANSYDLFQSGSKADGDTWQNISYYAPAWYRIFSEVTQSTYWENTVIPNVYTEIRYFYNNNSYAARGLVPNWHDPYNRSQVTGAPQLDPNTSYDSGFDACRIGWRIGTDYLWYGTSSDSLAYDTPFAVAAFMESTTSSDPRSIYTYSIPNGNTETGYNTIALTAPVGVAAMVSSSFNSWRNQIYTDLAVYYQDPQFDAYFARSIQLLSMLTMTGNFPNLWEREPSLLSDGGFEQGGSSWSFPSNAFVASYNMNSGNSSARMNSNGIHSKIAQIVYVAENTEYEICGYLRTTNLDSGNYARIVVRWYDSTSLLLGTEIIGEAAENEFYGYHQAFVTSPTDTSFAEIGLELSATQNGTAFFDDIKVRIP